MERAVPLWLVLFILLLCALFLVPFGWAVKVAAAGSERAGLFGEVAVQIADFPSKVKLSLKQLAERASGADQEVNLVVPYEEYDRAGFAPVPAATGIEIEGLGMKRGAGDLPAGWRILVGGFLLDGAPESAALLLSPELRIVRVWKLLPDDVGGGMNYPPHGFAFLPDGSLIIAHEADHALQRYTLCGERLWVTEGKAYHHSITLADDPSAAWSFNDRNTIAEISTTDGAVLRTIAMDDVIAANPEIDLFQVRRFHSRPLERNERNLRGPWLRDPFHLNDVEPLPAAYADAFPAFKTGDLLISMRSLNLLFVLDPETLKVKWWIVGVTERQHDPDWQPNGEITVLNNRMSRDYSEILGIDPKTGRTRVIFDGRKADFFTRVRGKHEIAPGGELYFVSPQQGRALEVSPRGEVMLEFRNAKPDGSASFVLNDYVWLPPEAIDPAAVRCGS